MQTGPRVPSRLLPGAGVDPSRSRDWEVLLSGCGGQSKYTVSARTPTVTNLLGDSFCWGGGADGLFLHVLFSVPLAVSVDVHLTFSVTFHMAHSSIIPLVCICVVCVLLHVGVLCVVCCMCVYALHVFEVCVMCVCARARACVCACCVSVCVMCAHIVCAGQAEF